MKKQDPPISRHGAALTGGSVVMLIGGGVLGDGILMLLGLCGLIFLAASWGLAWFSLRGLEVSVRVPMRVEAGRTFDLEVVLHNRRVILDAIDTQVIVSFPGRVCFSTHSAWTAAGAASRIIQPFALPERGYSDEQEGQLVTTFPLGLFRVARPFSLRQVITVLPRSIQPMELGSDGALHDAEPRGGVTVGQSFGEPRGVRPWQVGDSARRIHWPSSVRAMARGHDLRVREFDPPGFHPENCHLVFHSYASGGEMLRADRFERAISLLAGSLRLMQANGISCVFTADFNDWQPVCSSTRFQLIECLSRLARVPRCRGTEVHDLESALRGISSDQAVVVISDMTPDSWAHLLVEYRHAVVVDIRQIRYRHRVLNALEVKAS